MKTTTVGGTAENAFFQRRMDKKRVRWFRYGLAACPRTYAQTIGTVNEQVGSGDVKGGMWDCGDQTGRTPVSSGL